MPYAQTSSFVEPWLKYKTPIVRQLAFALASPNILSRIPNELNIQHSFNLHSNEHWLELYNNYESRLNALDLDSTELDIFLAKLKSTRLGLRFEMFFWFWLLDDKYHHYKLLAHSIQIIDGPKTVGELDFLIFNNKENRIEHWEVALKYYLAEKDLSLPFWYGLNRSDTFARKLNHFTQKQFQFSHALDYEISHKFAVMKGQLFLPEYSKNNLQPNWINTNRRLGVWGTSIKDSTQNFYRLNRQEWICPHVEQSSETALWWTDGLYLQPETQNFYMYRNANLLKPY